MKKINQTKFVFGFFVFFLFPLLLFAEEKCSITYAYLHTFSLGQESREMTSYSIYKNYKGYGGSINQVFPSPLNASKRSTTSTEKVLEKNSLEIENFINKMAKDFDLFKMSDLKPSTLPSHPTYYQFEFQDSCEKQIKFQYIRTADLERNKKYENLVKNFNDFFKDAKDKK